MAHPTLGVNLFYVGLACFTLLLPLIIYTIINGTHFKLEGVKKFAITILFAGASNAMASFESNLKNINLDHTIKTYMFYVLLTIWLIFAVVYLFNYFYLLTRPYVIFHVSLSFTTIMLNKSLFNIVELFDDLLNIDLAWLYTFADNMRFWSIFIVFVLLIRTLNYIFKTSHKVVAS